MANTSFGAIASLLTQHQKRANDLSRDIERSKEKDKEKVRDVISLFSRNQAELASRYQSAAT